MGSKLGLDAGLRFLGRGAPQLLQPQVAPRLVLQRRKRLLLTRGAAEVREQAREERADARALREKRLRQLCVGRLRLPNHPPARSTIASVPGDAEQG